MPAGIQPGRNGLLSYDRYGGVFREDERIGFVIEMHVKKSRSLMKCLLLCLSPYPRV